VGTVRCPFCHQFIDSSAYSAHEAEHRRLRPDGQQDKYVTLPPEGRFEGSLDGVPSVYRHEKCGRATGMPEEIIRSYLMNPYLYLADRTFCTGCGKHVPCRELRWLETGEDLQTYNDRLRAAKPEMKPQAPAWHRQFLETVREALGQPPRSMDAFTLAAFSSPPPQWLPTDDPLGEVYRRQTLLLQEGEVVWGHLVHANQNLFRVGPSDHPALTVYAASATFEDGFTDLHVIATRLFGLKDTTPENPDEQRAAARITNDRDRNMGWVVPATLTGGKEVFAASFMVFRAHLPQQHLQSGWFPLLIHANTPAVMIVPSAYWPHELVRRWSGQP
jgi:hypothetical protein